MGATSVSGVLVAWSAPSDIGRSTFSSSRTRVGGNATPTEFRRPLPVVCWPTPVLVELATAATPVALRLMTVGTVTGFQCFTHMHRSAYYHKQADHARRLADVTVQPNVEETLRRVARELDRLADDVATAEAAHQHLEMLEP